MHVREALRKFPVVVGFASLAIALALLSFPTGESLEAYCLREFAIALVMVAIAVAVSVNGARALRPSTVGMGFSFRKSIYFLIIVTALPAVLSLIANILRGNMFDVSNTPDVAILAVFCLCIGVLEETAARFLVLGGLLARWGDTKRGIVAAVVVSSVAFGLGHLVKSLIGGEFTSFEACLEGLGKVLQTGIMGLLLATLYVKTRNLTPCILIHALFDFFLSLPTVLYTGMMESGSYVSSDPETAMRGAISYFVLCAIYIPTIVSCVRMLRRVEPPFKGIFRQPVEPIKPPKRVSAKS